MPRPRTVIVMAFSVIRPLPLPCERPERDGDGQRHEPRQAEGQEGGHRGMSFAGSTSTPSSISPAIGTGFGGVFIPYAARNFPTLTWT